MGFLAFSIGKRAISIFSRFNNVSNNGNYTKTWAKSLSSLTLDSVTTSLEGHNFTVQTHKTVCEAPAGKGEAFVASTIVHKELKCPLEVTLKVAWDEVLSSLGAARPPTLALVHLSHFPSDPCQPLTPALAAEPRPLLPTIQAVINPPGDQSDEAPPVIPVIGCSAHNWTTDNYVDFDNPGHHPITVTVSAAHLPGVRVESFHSARGDFPPLPSLTSALTTTPPAFLVFGALRSADELSTFIKRINNLFPTSGHMLSGLVAAPALPWPDCDVETVTSEDSTPDEPRHELREAFAVKKYKELKSNKSLDTNIEDSSSSEAQEDSEKKTDNAKTERKTGKKVESSPVLFIQDEVYHEGCVGLALYATPLDLSSGTHTPASGTHTPASGTHTPASAGSDSASGQSPQGRPEQLELEEFATLTRMLLGSSAAANIFYNKVVETEIFNPSERLPDHFMGPSEVEIDNKDDGQSPKELVELDSLTGTMFALQYPSHVKKEKLLLFYLPQVIFPSTSSWYAEKGGAKSADLFVFEMRYRLMCSLLLDEVQRNPEDFPRFGIVWGDLGTCVTIQEFLGKDKSKFSKIELRVRAGRRFRVIQETEGVRPFSFGLREAQVEYFDDIEDESEEYRLKTSVAALEVANKLIETLEKVNTSLDDAGQENLPPAFSRVFEMFEMLQNYDSVKDPPFDSLFLQAFSYNVAGILPSFPYKVHSEALSETCTYQRLVKLACVLETTDLTKAQFMMESGKWEWIDPEETERRKFHKHLSGLLNNLNRNFEL